MDTYRNRSLTVRQRKPYCRAGHGLIVLAVLSLFFTAAAQPVNARQAAEVYAATNKAVEAESSSGFDDFDEFEDKDKEGDKKVFDPLSGYNRFMTGVNDKIYLWLLKPVSTGYSKVTPKVVRSSVNRFFTNLGYPVRFVNNVLQLKIRQAGVETARFLVNTTVGVAGFADPASKWMDLDPYPEDFGQTLGVYGVGGGFPFVLPLMGPSNLRDSIALVPDSFLNPVRYVEPVELSVGLSAYDTINYTSLHLGEYEKLKKDAIDWYIFTRDAYKQSREKKIEE